MEKVETIQIGPRIPKTLKKELDVICAREGKDVQDIVKECLEKYAKEHGDGNPVYALDKWVEEPKFKAVPALFSNTQTWVDYLLKCSETEREEIKDHISGLQNQFRKRGL